MTIGVFGLKASGKTTIFSLLTGLSVDPATRRRDGATAIAPVHDARLTELAGIFRPKKTTRAGLTFTDMPGFDSEADPGEKTRVMQAILNADALLCVVRAFVEPSVPWPVNGETPARQFDAIRTELLLRDLGVVESRLERITWTEQKHHRLSDDERREHEVLTGVRERLEAEQFVSRQQLPPTDARLIGSLNLFTAKPVIIAVNTDEEQLGRGAYPDRDYIRRQGEANGFADIELSGRIEAEISQLDAADRRAFLEAYGLSESGIERLSRIVYRHVGLISFLTVGEDEVRAWTIRLNTRARDAAGAIHTRLAKTFVRAEVIPYDSFMTVGDMKLARARGLVRLAGRDEIVQDGDIFHVRAGG
ncbi:MAG TPA: redox-regulated ATPase YchF [candidate division WOR-3 bacterium]|uniref:Redox-regulated ATPase YchF n=1 Tax=candidate division WOR-3 bacterium TaxID=2052148 RepID=A0A7V0XEJ2_UNCW3|nr:redox-regulated ATPase YchF [candidate division WOR-3 bacterium]